MLCSALGRWERVLGHEDEPVSATDVARTLDWVERRAAGEPLAYLRGEEEFYGRVFRVNPSVLIPRPETEDLVGAVLREEPRGLVVDVGTGSGAIAITLAVEIGARVGCIGVDRSGAALAVARENARRLGAAVRFVQGDLLAPFGGRAAAIVANLPYVTRFEYPRLSRDVLCHEPRAALVPERESVDAMRRRLVRQASRRLLPAGLLALEVGAGQAGRARDDLLSTGFDAVRILPDLAGIGRVVKGRWGTPGSSGP